MASYSVSLEKLITALGMEPVYLPEAASNLFISSADVNRPGLHLAGFVEHFEPTRVQILGKMESAYLESLDPEVRKQRIDSLLSKKIPALVVTRSLEIYPEMIDSAKTY